MRVIFCTTPLEKADDYAEILLKDQLVACVNIIPKVKSKYTWEGKICTDEESLMIIKTKSELVEKIINRIKEIHEYDIPEIISFEIKEGSSDYLNWIKNVTL
jgi:periplasmic divalent cation tolerance protein